MELIRETVFEHEEGREKATITAAEQWSVNLLKKLAEEFPEQVDIYVNKDGSIFGHVPWKWMKLTPPRRISDELRKKLSEAGKASAEKRLGGK